MTTLLAERTLLCNSLTNLLQWTTFTVLLTLMTSLLSYAWPLSLTTLTTWVDFFVQVFDKFAEVDDFDDSADFDDFTVQDDGMSKPADRINYSALQPNLRVPPSPVPV